MTKKSVHLDFLKGLFRDSALFFCHFRYTVTVLHNNFTITFSGKVVRAKGLGLTLHSVSANDKGAYQCTVNTFQGAIKTASKRGVLQRLVVRGKSFLKYCYKRGAISQKRVNLT